MGRRPCLIERENMAEHQKYNGLGPIKMGLMVGIPYCGRPIQMDWALSMWQQRWPLNTNLKYNICRGDRVDESRNSIATMAVNEGFRYLWFVDDDTSPPYFAADKLINDIEQADDGVAAAGGIYFAKKDPTEPVVYKVNGQGAFWKWDYGEVFECMGIGTGCLMIKVEALKNIPQPWFRIVDDKYDEGDLRRLQVSDDLYFCQQATGAGYKILADGGVVCIHWDVDTGRHYTLPEGSYPARKMAKQT
jgi:hypothetical protein